MGAFQAIIEKEIRSIAKERTIMLAIIIQLIIASLSSVILFGLMSYYDPSSIGQNSGHQFNCRHRRRRQQPADRLPGQLPHQYGNVCKRGKCTGRI